MSQYFDGNVGPVTAGAAIPQYARVIVGSGGTVTAAGVGVRMHGTIEDEALASGDVVAMRYANAGGTRKMIAAGAISRGAPVFAVADGEVDASGTVLEGYAMEAATTDQDIIEVLTFPGTSTEGYLDAAQAALSGAGALGVVTYYTAWTTTGAQAGTLANGAFPGQLKKIKLIVDGGDGTLTPVSLTGGTTITFADAGDYCVLRWNGEAWTAIELGNDADGATAPVLA